MSDIVLKGYVQARRGVLSHLLDGRMTLQEFAVFHILLYLADKATGSYNINSGAVMFWTNGQIGKDGADRALRGLEEKGYIVRDITPGHKGVYPYHIQKYLPTAGSDEGKVLTFTKKPNGAEKIAELLDYFGAEAAEEMPTVMPMVMPTDGADKTRREKRNGKPESKKQRSKETNKEEAPVASLPSPIEGSPTNQYLGASQQSQDQTQPLSEPTPESDTLGDIWMSATGKWFEMDDEAGWSDVAEANRLIADHGFDEVAAVLQNTLTERPKSAGMEWTDFRVFARNYDLNKRKWKAWKRAKKAKGAVAGVPGYRNEKTPMKIKVENV